MRQFVSGQVLSAGGSATTRWFVRLCLSEVAEVSNLVRMKFLTDPIVNSAKDVAALSARLVEDGVGFLKTSIGSIPIFSGTKVYVAEIGMGADETHYFLIPFRAVERGYAIATMRVLPEGTGPENDLPKHRIFHLPHGVEIESLEQFLREDLADQHAASEGGGSELADRLEAVAEEIDKKSNVVTGGLLLIGGAVAIANPLVGVGIAAKALIPGVGAVLSREGLKKFGDVLRKKRAGDIEEKADKKAAREVKRMRPEVHENQLLSRLEEAVSTTDRAFDPATHVIDSPAGPAAMRVRSITAEAVLNTYRDILDGDAEAAQEARLDAPDLAWLRSLEALLVERNQG